MATLTVTRRELRQIDPSKNQRKFYVLYTSDLGHVIFHWGRIDTAGQFKVEKIEPNEVEDYARRQMYSKLSKGYVREGEDVFQADSSDFRHPNNLERSLKEYRQNHGVQEATDTTTREIDAFTEQVNKLITATKSSSSADLMEEYLALLDAWKEIQSSYATAETALDMLGMRMKGEI